MITPIPFDLVADIVGNNSDKREVCYASNKIDRPGGGRCRLSTDTSIFHGWLNYSSRWEQIMKFSSSGVFLAQLTALVCWIVPWTAVGSPAGSGVVVGDRPQSFLAEKGSKKAPLPPDGTPDKGAAKSAARPNDCDRLAAHPDDARRKAPGLWSWAIDKPAALTACKAALLRYSDTPRFHMQYGRVLYLAGRRTESFKHYRTAAASNYRLAMVLVGNLYVYGIGVARDPEEGVKWLGKARAQGSKLAELVLASMQLRGTTGVKHDPKAALLIVRRWADRGHPIGQVNLALAYGAGWGVDRNLAAAVTWYRKAAEQGLPFAQTRLAAAYEQGVGVPRSYKRALKWFRRAATRNDKVAEFQLARMYWLGRGVKKDTAEAFEWSMRASRGGHAPAQYLLGTFYEQGIGLKANLPEAYFWYSLASRRGEADAKRAMSRLDKRVTAPQKAEIEKRVAAWKLDR